MFAKLESLVHRWRRRLSRNEWAIRNLGLKPSEGTSEEPGLLLIQIDGLARSQLEKALARGRLPFLRRLLRRENYECHDFYPGLPTTTPAVQAELYYGVRAAVPAFSFFDRKKERLGMMFYPDWAKEFEANFQTQAEGLLRGGSSWSNIYTGGAGQEESHFCAASIGFGDMWRTGKIRNIFLFILLHFPAALRIAGLLIAEIGIAFWDAVKGICQGERTLSETTMILSRVFIGIGVRELVTIGGSVDVTRGLPIIHVNFLGYDELAHRRGPSSAFAHWSLRGIDRRIKQLYQAARHSRRRDYAVWIFSDHGQEHTRSFALETPGGIEAIVQDCLELSQKRDPAWRPRSQRRPPAPWLSHGRGPRSLARLETLRTADQLSPSEATTFTVAAMGPVGHVYFAQALTDERRLALARRLVHTGKVPGVLLRTADGQLTWLHAEGETAVPDGVPDLLPHPEPLRAEIARDLLAFGQNVHAGDLILLGWAPKHRPWSFAPERGAHGGLGKEETHGFLLLPARTRLPAGTEHFVRPLALRAAARHYLGRERLPPAETPPPDETRLRIVTYNTHGCVGMDGRISPRRIARALASYAPDIVALQELDLGHRRSRAEDQAAQIARDLDLHFVFCPTVTRGEEHYGHALLSRWPIEIVRRSFLPADRQSWWPEPRAALWGRIHVGRLTVHVITTHLGLGRRERLLQMRALLGEGWIGHIPPDEPVILCGDFNLAPGSVAYGLAAARLRDVQAARQGHRPANTFSSFQPFIRIDHIFTSAHFEPRQVFVPRNALTRLASDHLPVVADLQVDLAARRVEVSRNTITV